MKKLLILAMLHGTFGFSQIQIKETSKADINWGTTLKIDKKSTFQEVISHDKSGYYILKSDKKGESIEKLSSELALENSRLLPLEYQKKGMMLEGLAYFNDKIIMLSSFNDRKLKKNSLFYQVIDPSSLGVDGGLQNVGEITYEKRRFQGAFGYDVSIDDSKMLLFFQKPYIKDAPEEYSFKVLDKNLSMLWDQEVQLPFKEQFFTVSDYEVSQNGDVFVLGKEFDEDKSAKTLKDLPNYKYHIIGYFNKGKKIVDYEVSISEKFIKDITFDVHSNGDIICSGFYSENSGSGIKGAYFLSIDGTTRKVKKESFKEFDEKFITQGWTDKQVNKAKKKEVKKQKAIEMYNYDLRDFIVREDGGVVLLAEQYYLHIVTTTSTDANGNTRTTTTYHYYYNDIIVVNIDPKGNIAWTTKIEKTQHSTNDGGRLSSYALQVKGDMIYLIYNESAKQFFSKEERSEMKSKDKRSYLTLLVSLNDKGEYEKEILLNNSDEGVYTVPKLCEQVSEDEMLIYSKSRKGQRFGIMTIK